MSDDADFAFRLEDAARQRGLASVSANIPAGLPGECDECGEIMPRLVGGRCGFCRDGRRPPAATYERVAARLQPEETSMTTDSRAITIPVPEPLKGVIEEYAAKNALPLGRAALEFADAGWKAMQAAAAPVADEPLNLADVPDNQLAAELQRRLLAGVSGSDYEAAIARAEAAESKLASVAEVLGTSK